MLFNRKAAGVPVSIKHVSFRHKGAEGGRLALDDVCLDIQAGQVVVLCGRSGCGKTTVTRLVNGLIPHFYEGDLWGEVSVGGIDPSVESITETAALVGSVFQNPRSQFFNVDTTSELVFACENMGWDVSRIDSALKETVERFELQTLLNRSLFRLSGGEKQKIACASVSVHQPGVMVLDEPASNLDMRAIHMLSKIIAEWKAEGRTVIVAEHRLGYLYDVADRFVMLESGHVVWDRTTKEVSSMEDEEFHALGLRSMAPVSFRCQPEVSDFGNTSSEEATPGVEIRRMRFSHKRVSGLLESHGGASYDRYSSASEPKGIYMKDVVFHAGAIVGVVGDNGAGKSTFARCLCGLEKCCDDDISIDGEVVCSSQRRRLCYMVMQDVNHQLFTESVAEEVALSLRGNGCYAGKEAIDTVLAGLDLSGLEESHPMALSGGQKQRVAIASAVASGRRVCLFDEPTSGLDWTHMLDTARNLRHLSNLGVTCLVITHDPELVSRCCDEVLFLENGRVSWSGPLSDADVSCRIEEYFSCRVEV